MVNSKYDLYILFHAFPIGKSKSRSKPTVTQKVAPSIEKHLEDSMATEGQTFQLDCLITGIYIYIYIYI